MENYQLLGETRDDAAGEAFDKGARILGLGYPGGPEIEKAAKGGNPNMVKFPRSLLGKNNLEFSFSGLKTSLLYFMDDFKETEKISKKDVIASYQEAIIDVLIIKLKRAMKMKKINTCVIAGGVAANEYLRENLNLALDNQKIIFPDLSYCTDNGAMISYLGEKKLKFKNYKSMSFGAFPESKVVIILNFEFTYSSHLIWFLIGIIFITIYYSFREVFNFSNYRLFIIFRLFSFALLIFLFFDPKFNFSILKVDELPWNIYIDKSLSMAYHSKPSSVALTSGVDNLINQLNKKTIKNKIFSFGSEIDTNWVLGKKSFSQGSTNLGMVLDHIKSNKNEKSAGSVIITDGQANLGKEIEIQELNNNKPIHIVGVGDTSPSLDVAIKSIDAPPVIIKGENAELVVYITYNGNPNKKLNITLYSQNKLMGSKVISSSGNNSIDKVRFMISPDLTGKMEYRVQVNAIADEINIQNNKQVFYIQVLKNIYRVAIITGAPNFNTQFLKKNIFDNSKVKVDHFIYRNNIYSTSLKQFWETKYDLIIFDNHPIKDNADEWNSYLRVFAKKILSQKTSLALIAGYDIEEATFESYLKLMEINYKKSIIKLGSEFPWSITENWDRTFPFTTINF